jgi:hypothetical protein
MTFQLHPQEIYLLERYISLEYFGELRDRWEALIKHIDRCLSAYMQSLPPDYRGRHVSEQPDITWEHRVLPNFRSSLQALNEGYIRLSHRDFSGLHCAWGPRGDYKGQLDYSPEWMRKEDELIYHDLLEKSRTYAINIAATEGAEWDPYDLLKYSRSRGPLNPPESWPAYRVNKAVSVISGQKLRHSGIYIPDVDNSCAQFLSSRYDEAPEARVCVGVREIPDPVTGEKWDEALILEERPCTWYLVDRSIDSENTALPINANPVHVQRHAEGESCHVAGFYFTPARPDSRRFFDKGAIFPGFDAAYGKTIWQWDDVQT